MLARTLPTLLNQDLPHADYEVVVVSDGSIDGTVEFVRSFKTTANLRIIDQPHRGLSATRNAGIEAAGGELVLLLDDDLVAEPTLASRHVAEHIDGLTAVPIAALRT